MLAGALPSLASLPHSPEQILTVATVSFADFDPTPSAPAGGLRPQYHLTTQYRFDDDTSLPVLLASTAVSIALHRHTGGVLSLPLASAVVPLRALLSPLPTDASTVVGTPAAVLLAARKAQRVSLTVPLVSAETGQEAGQIAVDMRLLYPIYPLNKTTAGSINFSNNYIPQQSNASNNIAASTRGVSLVNPNQGPTQNQNQNQLVQQQRQQQQQQPQYASAATAQSAAAAAAAAAMNLSPLALMRLSLARLPVSLLGARLRLRVDLTVRALHAPMQATLQQIHAAVTSASRYGGGGGYSEDDAGGAGGGGGSGGLAGTERWVKGASDKLVIHASCPRLGLAKGVLTVPYLEFMGHNNAADGGSALDSRRYVAVIDSPLDVAPLAGDSNGLREGDVVVFTLYLPTLGGGDGSGPLSTGPLSAPGLVEVGAVHVPLTALTLPSAAVAAAAAGAGGGKEWEGELPLTTARAMPTANCPVQGEVLVTYGAAMVAMRIA